MSDRRVIGMDKAQRIAAVWNSDLSLRENMEAANADTNDMRCMNRYRRAAEDLLGIRLDLTGSPQGRNNWPRTSEHIKAEGSAVVFSDAHFWPKTTSPAYFGLLEVLHQVKPQIVLDNGDSFDGATISRHAPISFDHLPSLADEYKCCLEHMDGIIDASGKQASFYRNVGNHDLRFEGKMASKVPEMIGMPATTIGELFPKWKHNYSIVFNDELIAMHKWHCGIHAAWNNVLKAGKSIMTSHTHRLKVLPHTDYGGRKYSIETGCLADPEGPQFSYCLDTAKDWQPGFVVIEFDENGIHPEVAELIGGRVRFRGKYYG